MQLINLLFWILFRFFSKQFRYTVNNLDLIYILLRIKESKNGIIVLYTFLFKNKTTTSFNIEVNLKCILFGYIKKSYV